MAAPSGEWSNAMAHLRTLLAYSPTFQAWVGATEPTESERVATAKTKIYESGFGKDEAAVPVKTLRPYAIICDVEPPEWRRYTDTGGARNHYQGAGAFDVFFEADVEEAVADSVADMARAVRNKVGTIVAEMEEHCGNSESCFLYRATSIKHAARADEDERQDPDGGDYWQVIVRFEWGPE